MEGSSVPHGTLFFFRLSGGESHEFRFKAERNVPGGTVAVFGEVLEWERMSWR